MTDTHYMAGLPSTQFHKTEGKLPAITATRSAWLTLGRQLTFHSRSFSKLTLNSELKIAEHPSCRNFLYEYDVFGFTCIAGEI